MDGFNWEKVDEKIDRNYNANTASLLVMTERL